MSRRHAPITLTVSHEPHSGANIRIPKRWLLVARVALLAISVLALVVYIVGVPANLAWLASFSLVTLGAAFPSIPAALADSTLPGGCRSPL
jgi:hypothetical protein